MRRKNTDCDNHFGAKNCTLPTQRQNEFFKNQLIHDKYLIEDKVKLIRCGLSVVQDSKTGLYKLCIDNKLYDIPERKVEIGVSDTDIGEFPIPEIVD